MFSRLRMRITSVRQRVCESELGSSVARFDYNKDMIIVTMKYNETIFDLQLPSDMAVGELLGWILDYVNKLCEVKLKPENVALVSDRKEEVIRTDMTLEEFGVWNGDYITVLDMGS